MSGVQEFLEAASTIPSVERFLSAMVADIAGGRSPVALLPPGIDPDAIWSLLDERLFRREFRQEIVNVATVSGFPENPNTFVADHIPSVRDDSISREEAMLSPYCPEVIRLRGIGEVEREVRREWVRLLRQWTTHLRAASPVPQGVRTLCLIERASTLIPDMLPPEGIHLSLRWWWGFPSAEELRAYCRRQSTGSRARDAWLECLVAGVAAGDLSLAVALRSVCPESIEDLERTLLEYAVKSGFEQDCSAHAGHFRAARLLSTGTNKEPVEAIREDWAHGFFVSSPEYGVEIHPSLVCSSGEGRRIGFRLWRGQIGLLFPLIDRVRLWVAQELEHQYGQRWFETVGILPDNENDVRRLAKNCLDAELGYLVAVVRALGNRVLLDSLPDQLSLAHRIRSELAHHQPVDMGRFSLLWEAVHGE